MQKKFIIISFIVAVLIWVGYMVSRHMGHESMIEETNERTYQDLIRIAKESPNGGLIHVGLKLNKYNKQKGEYPERLIDLYPEYLPSEEYINDIQWDYERSGENDFRLTKTIVVDGEQQIRRIDKSFRIATVRTDRPTEIAEITDDTDESENELGVMVASPVTKSGTEAETTAEEAVVSGETEQVEVDEAEKTIGPMVAKVPEIVTVVEEEIAPGIDSKIGYGYLVWRDEKGRLGFGNVNYPSSYRLSIYKDGAYHDIRRPRLQEKKLNLAETNGEEETKEEIASRMGEQVLVWKNKDGTLGFGNVDYPSSRRLSVYNDGAYQNIHRLRSNERASNLSETAVTEKTKDEIASSISRRDLVWRNKDGTLGFGNVDYPKGDKVTHINVNGEWEKK